MVTAVYFPPVVTPGSSSAGFCAPQGERNASGFTLIELLVVVALVAILLALGVPGFRELIAGQRVKNASFDVFSSLVHARSEAITRNATVTMAAVGGDWASGWTVTESGGTVVRRQDAYPNITITLDPPGTISFNGMGRANATASFSIDTPGVIERNKRCIIIDLSGRPVTKTGTCS